jgi:rare lipoprotein A
MKSNTSEIGTNPTWPVWAAMSSLEGTTETKPSGPWIKVARDCRRILTRSPLPQLSPCLLKSVGVKAGGSMRTSFFIFGLALAWSISSSAQAHSRGFAWFFAHSRPHGSCSGQHVVATFYVSGRRTANGQTFDPSGLSAAHRTLPFGSQVTVTNPENGRSVTVVINDRGPFTRGVTIDLTRGAARAIGMHGTQWVCMI